MAKNRRNAEQQCFLGFSPKKTPVHPTYLIFIGFRIAFGPPETIIQSSITCVHQTIFFESFYLSTFFFFFENIS